MTTLREFNAALHGLLDVPLLELNTQLDQFLVGLTRRTPVHCLRTSVPVILTPRSQLTPRQCRRLRKSLLLELRRRCRVQR